MLDSGYPDVRLVAVSKRKGVDSMKEAVEAGIRDLGENRIQEAVEKFSQEPFPGVDRHFIAPIQSNKLGRMLEYFQWFHGLESMKIAEAIDGSGSSIKCLVEVNTTDDPGRHGVKPEDLQDLAVSLSALKNIRIVGLMTMAPFTDDRDRIRRSFRTLAVLSREMAAHETQNISYRELSMGMSGDFDIAQARECSRPPLPTSNTFIKSRSLIRRLSSAPA